MIDLRSDTVTKPSPAMRRAMADAEVGDDVYGEDPTVNALQEEVADLFGKEAALFVPSGTMANQISIKAQTQPGDEVIIHPSAHIIRAESGAGAAISGVQFRPVGNADGTMAVEKVVEAIQGDDNPHFAPTRLVCMENTHNFAGGSILPLDSIAAVSAAVRERGLRMHLDGARVMNAAVALDVQPERIAAHFDSATLCFSKGLGAPVGSVILGGRKFIGRCLRYRKMFGGGLRQAGILAAAARHALRHHVARLAEDHVNARHLAEAIDHHPHLHLCYGFPETNLVFFSCDHPRVNLENLVGELGNRGIALGMVGGVARAVTHLDVTHQDMVATVAAMGEILAN